ncbi:MAG: 2-oxoacid:acceptor oxidoreductase family protein [Elusimicrobiota bacterium]
MKEIRIHARAGQGAITTAALLGDAVFRMGGFAYAFPHFGAARMGAPMNAFVRMNDKPIRLRSQIKEPDYVIVVDETIMHGSNVFSGIKPGGIVIINSAGEITPPPENKEIKIRTIPASKIAEEILGRPIGNTVLLGAFACATGEVSLEALEDAVKKRFSVKIAEKNIEMLRRGYKSCGQGNR